MFWSVLFEDFVNLGQYFCQYLIYYVLYTGIRYYGYYICLAFGGCGSSRLSGCVGGGDPHISKLKVKTFYCCLSSAGNLYDVIALDVVFFRK